MINSNVVLSQDDEYPKMDQRAFFVSIGENDDRPWDGNCVHHSWNLFHHDGQKQKPMVISMKRIVPNWIDIYIYMCMCVFMLSIVFLWTCDKQVRVLHFQSHRIPWEIRSPSADPIHPATEVAGPWLWQIWTFTPKPFWAKAARTLVLWLSLQRPSRNHRDCAWNCRIYNAYIYIHWYDDDDDYNDDDDDDDYDDYDDYSDDNSNTNSNNNDDNKNNNSNDDNHNTSNNI